MAVYLIDYENVNANGLDGIELLGTNDSVYIFYSANADKLTFETHARINSSAAEIHYVCTNKGGKNALDFQLSTFLGYSIAKKPNDSFYIVSKDNGFNCLSEFWIARNARLETIVDLKGNSRRKAEAELLASLQDVADEKDAKTVAEYIGKYKSKQGLNNALVKKFGSEKAGVIYKRIKPRIADKKGK